MMVPSRRWLLGAVVVGFVAPIAIWVPAMAAVWLSLSALWAGALILDLIRVAGFAWDQLEIERIGSAALSIDRPLPVRYRWAHPDGGTLWIRETSSPLVAEAGADRVIVLRAGRDLVEERIHTPVRRGRTSGWRCDLRLGSPWGLGWWQARREVDWALTVYPRLRTAAIEQLPSLSRLRQEAGLRQVRRLGEGRLFESLREWVPGDEIRTVDWKATARRGKLIARQYEDERRQRVLLALDAGRMLTAETDGRARLEDAIEAIAQLAYRAVGLDDDVGLLVFSDGIDHYLPPLRGRRALRAVLDVLAVVEGKLVEPDYPKAFAFLAAQTRKRALTVVFTDVIDRFASEALLAQVGRLRPRHVPVAVTIRDVALERLTTGRVGEVEQAFERAAAEHLLQVRAEALADLRGQGVVIVDAHPDAVARSVVDCYHRLKRRALI